MLDYFGQSPIIVRSSSLLEDNYGNAFAGKYESVFCPNQGPHRQAVGGIPLGRQDDLRQHHEREGPALPRPAGAVGPGRADVAAGAAGLRRRATAACSFRRSPAWPSRATPTSGTSASIPAAGVVRLVFGLGTRAVDRSDDDYTRIVALNAPERRPESDLDRVRQYSQRKVDVIDLEANQFVSRKFADVAAAQPAAAAAHLRLARRAAAHRRAGREPPDSRDLVLTFDELLSRDALRRRHARDAPDACRRPTIIRSTSSSPPISSADGRLQDQPGAVPAAASGLGRRGRRAAQDDRARTTACWRPTAR